jgi:hypothetical protein
MSRSTKPGRTGFVEDGCKAKRISLDQAGPEKFRDARTDRVIRDLVVMAEHVQRLCDHQVGYHNQTALGVRNIQVLPRRSELVLR